MIRLQSGSTPFWIRIVISSFSVAIFGGLGYVIIKIIIKIVFNDLIDYTTSTIFTALLYEWILIATPIFIPIVPILFISGKYIFQKRSIKTLMIYAAIGGIVLTLPEFLFIRWRWMELHRIIEDLPVTNVKYHHSFPLFPAANLHGDLTITFIIPRESFQTVHDEILRQTRDSAPYYSTDLRSPYGRHLVTPENIQKYGGQIEAYISI